AEVADVGRRVLAGERMPGADPGIEAQLLGGFQLRRRRPAALALLDELGRVAIPHRDLLGDRMIGRDGDEAGAEDRVGTRGVDFDRLAARKIETELQALARSEE